MMKLRISVLGISALVLGGCGAAEQRAIQPLAGTASVELGQQQSQTSGGSPTVQGLSPQLPPTGPDGGPL